MSAESRPNPLLYLVKAAWAHSAGQRGRIILYVTMAVAGLGVILCEPIVIGRMLNAVQIGGPTDQVVRTVGGYLLIYLGIHATFWSLHGPSRVIERGVAFHTRLTFQTRLFNILMALPVGWHKEHHSGETIDKLSRATSGMFEFCDRSFEVIHLCTRFAGSLVALFFFLPSAAFLALAATIVAVTVTLLFDRWLIRGYDQLNQRFSHAAAAVHDYLTNVVTVLCLRLEANVKSEVFRRLRLAMPLFKRNAVVNELKWFVSTMMVVGTVAGILIWHCNSTLRGGGVLMAGTFFTLFEYLRRIGDSFYGFANKYGMIVQFAANVRGVEFITRSFDDALETATRAALPAGWREVAIDRLAYTYEDDKHRLHHLKDVSLRLAPGRKIALVGASGSGKSTLLSILRGLRSPDEVKVACDGQPLPHGVAHVAHHATLIPQDPEIFADTVWFNVCMGLEADQETILDAIRQARFEAVLKRLPAGLQTNIAEKGVNLSGGEKQRLALARGIFFGRQSDIILLDEPTSSVDFHNEKLIYQSLLDLFRDRCIVSALHRLHLLPLFDEVVMLADGRIVERGTFAELLERDGLLASLWQSHRADVPAAAH